MIRRVPPVGPTWAQTFPASRVPALGHVDWISEAGRPLRATLHEDGHWSCTSEEMAALLDAFFEPSGHVFTAYGMDCLNDLAKEVGGKIVLAHPDLALPPSAGQGMKH